MIIKIKSLKLFVIHLLIILVCGCSADNSDLKKYINDIKNRPSRILQPIPKFAPLASFKFPEHDMRRSPFKPADQKNKSDEFAPDQKRRKQPLEAFTLDSLKFVGTLKQAKEIWALIDSPDKKVTPVKLGDYIGQNYGKIISIKDDEIKLEETIKNSGTWQKHTTTLNLNTRK